MGPSENHGDDVCLNEHMYTVDFAAAQASTRKYFSDLSFSYITWRTIEQLQSGEVSIQNLDEETLKQITFTILPNGQTAFHMLMNNTDAIETIF